MARGQPATVPWVRGQKTERERVSERRERRREREGEREREREKLYTAVPCDTGFPYRTVSTNPECTRGARGFS